jgi:DnaK suppressor protein
MDIDVDSQDRDEVLAELRNLLRARHHALNRALQGDVSELESYNQKVSGDLLDSALDSEQYEVSSRLVSVQSEELAKTELALRRMTDGTYGQCEGCDGSIGLPRLVALPYTTICIECARAEEREGSIPAPHAWGRSHEDADNESMADMEAD